MKNKSGMLNWLRLVICENGIIIPRVRDIPNVDLVVDPCLKLHTFFYGVPMMVRIEGRHL